MTLDDIQKKTVARWIEDGLKLAEIQKRLESELNVRMTYMEVRFLVDDLKLTPRDPEPESSSDRRSGMEKAGKTDLGDTPSSLDDPTDFVPEGSLPGDGGVSVTVDQLARPGTVVSGKVRFSDGQAAGWHLDTMGRLGVAPDQTGYKPSPKDLQAFQIQLQNELARLGF